LMDGLRRQICPSARSPQPVTLSPDVLAGCRCRAPSATSGLLWKVAYRRSVMPTRRGPRGQFNSLYGTTTLRLRPELPYPPPGPRYERLVFAADGQLIVPLNEWYHLMKGLGAARMHETYLAVLRPWF